MGLLDAMSLECDYGVPVELMLDGYRKISAAEGLAGVSVRELVVPAVGRHGSVSRTRHRQDRQIVLTCMFLDVPGGDPDRAWTEYYAVARALNCAVDTERLLRWTVGDLDLQAEVRLVEAKAPVEVGPALIRSQITFRAPDPRAYSQTLSEAFVSVLGTG